MTTIMILTIAVITSIIILNAILVKECLNRDITFSEIISENANNKISEIFMYIIAAPAALIVTVINHKDDITEWFITTLSDIKDIVTEKENYMVLIPTIIALMILVSFYIFNINLSVLYVLLAIAVILAIAGIGHEIHYYVKSRKEVK